MRIFQAVLLLFAMTLLSCGDKKNNSNASSVENNTVRHYICENGCENSWSDMAGNCPTCNTPFTHNQAWHDKDFLKSGPLNVPKDELLKQTEAPSQSPARNAQGVYHYTCPNGCSGGAASATECNNCGDTLVHNTAYHN